MTKTGEKRQLSATYHLPHIVGILLNPPLVGCLVFALAFP